MYDSGFLYRKEEGRCTTLAFCTGRRKADSGFLYMKKEGRRTTLAFCTEEEEGRRTTGFLYRGGGQTYDWLSVQRRRKADVRLGLSVQRRKADVRLGFSVQRRKADVQLGLSIQDGGRQMYNWLSVQRGKAGVQLAFCTEEGRRTTGFLYSKEEDT